MCALSSSLRRLFSVRQSQRLAPLPGTTCIPVPKHSEHVAGAKALSPFDADDATCVLSSGVTLIASSDELAASFMDTVLLLSPAVSHRFGEFSNPRRIFRKKHSASFSTQFRQRHVYGLAVYLQHRNACLG